MTDFELSLAAALREQAEEISMSVDQQSAAEEMRTRFDRADQRRRRWFVGLAVAAAAVVVVTVAIVVTRPDSDSDSVSPITPPPSYSGLPFTASINPPMSLDLPSWTADADTNGTDSGFFNFEELDSCAGMDGASPCPADADLKLRLLSLHYVYDENGKRILDPSYDDYVAHLDGLEPLGIATISDRSTTTVGGRPATLMSLAVLRDAPGAVACTDGTQLASDCSPLVAGRAARVAVVDQGADRPPTLIYLSLNGDAPDLGERSAEFDAMVETVSFG